MSPTAFSCGDSGCGDRNAVEAIPAMKEEPNELSYTEKNALEDLCAVNSEHFLPWAGKVSVSSIIELAENKF